MNNFKIEILYEDNHLLVVNKPAGLLTQPDNTGQQSLQEIYREWLKTTYSKPGNVFLEAVHRLDKPVGGIVLFAKTSKALSRLNESMRAKGIKKIYRAKVSGKLMPEQGALVHYLVHGDHKAIISSANDSQAKEARLRYTIIEQTAQYAEVEIELETGRYHQIRAQFAAIGCPLLGDTKYGGPHADQLALQHVRLEFLHPVGGQSMQFDLRDSS